MPRNPLHDAPASPVDGALVSRCGYDVLVVGAGPAGEALAGACAREGLAVVLVDPTPEAEWVPAYATWVDDLEAAGLDLSVCCGVWDELRVHVDDAPIRIGRAYARIDNARLRAALRAPTVEVRGGVVHDVEASPEGFRVRLGHGATLEARVVVDASGHGGRFVDGGGGARLFQAAVGRLGVLAPDSAPFDGACWMDFRPLPGERPDHAPTFLYGMALPDGRTFLEETSLLRGPAVPFETLSARLDARMAHLGLRFAHVDAHERCLIPMDAALPVGIGRAGPTVLPYGGAAAMVHPATGFLVGDVLRRAAPVARALADGLGAGKSPAQVVAAAWDTIWPRERVRGRDMHLFGAAALAAMGPGEVRAFFRAFFALPVERRDAFLGSGFDAGSLAATMLALFLDAPMSVRASLVSRGVSRGLPPLTRATFAPFSEVLR